MFEAISNIVNGHDTLAILPTSFGKSLIFQLLPSVCEQLDQKPNNAIVVVVSPLKSLIEHQIKAANEMSSLGLKACFLSTGSFEDILEGKYNIIIDTPESWLNDSKWKNNLHFSDET